MRAGPVDSPQACTYMTLCAIVLCLHLWMEFMVVLLDVIRGELQPSVNQSKPV